MRRLGDRAVWMRARARNALRRPIAMSVWGSVFAIVALTALMFVPREASREAANVAQRIPDRPDTTSVVRVKQTALTRLAVADSLLFVARRQAATPVVQLPEMLSAEMVAHRDSIVNLISSLRSAIARAENAPLAASYRALGEFPQVGSAPGVRARLDSLSVVERERESFGAVAAVDPTYIALTARVSEIGRGIIAAANSSLRALRVELAPLIRTAPMPRPAASIDTMRILADRADAQAFVQSAESELVRMRIRHRQIDAMERRARELTRVGASLSATVGSALVVGLALGFAIILLAEMQRPRISDVHEAEQTAGARVLAVVQPRAAVHERARRSIDVDIPDTLEPFAEHYRQLHLHLATREEPLTSITITGEDPKIASVVGVNLAAYNVREARSALVVDTDPLASGIARAFGIPVDPGLTAVLAGQSDWPSAVRYVTVGRDQILSVMPSGRRAGAPSAERAARLRSDLQRMASRHDLIVLVAAVGQARSGPTSIVLTPDVVVCVRLAHTRLRTLSNIVETLRAAGMKIHGLVLWDAESPQLPDAAKTGRPADSREPTTVGA